GAARARRAPRPGRARARADAGDRGADAAGRPGEVREPHARGGRVRAGARAQRAHRARDHGGARARERGRGARPGGAAASGRLGVKRVIAIAGFLAFAVLLGAAYPLLVKGPELGGAEWQYPWYLLALLIVPWLFWRGTYGEDARRP